MSLSKTVWPFFVCDVILGGIWEFLGNSMLKNFCGNETRNFFSNAEIFSKTEHEANA